MAAFLSYGGSRFFWFLENAARILVNLDLLITFIHTLLVCVKEPNKLVAGVFSFLSCRYTMAALASRSIMFVEFVSVARFVTNRLLGRRDVHKFTTLAVECLRNHLPRGEFLNRVRTMDNDAGWQKSVDGWRAQQAKYHELVWKAALPYADLWPHFFKPGCDAVADGLMAYMDPDDADDPLMEHAPVNTDLLESTFGCLDYINKMSHSVDIWANFGQAVAIKTGIFISTAKRLRIENTRRKALGLLKMTGAEELKFLMQSPMAMLDNMNEKEFEAVHEMARKAAPPEFKKFRLLKNVQMENDLKRKEEQVKEQEAREAKALRRYKDKENFEVFVTLEALHDEMSKVHQSGLAKYTTAMKCDIVRAQLQYRRDCLARCLRPGAMCSNFQGPATEKLKQLLENFKAVLRDEGSLPCLMEPPCIRRKYAAHMFATSLRTQLDRDRNSVTAAMTEAFLAAYAGGVFAGWRCTVDYSLSNPLNPEALIGMEVSETFGGVEYRGVIDGYIKGKRWWKIHYDDGDREELNYRELVKLTQPPDFSKLKYEPPAAEFESFMRASGGAPTLINDNAGTKPGEPGFFTLESQEWTFISVFLVQASFAFYISPMLPSCFTPALLVQDSKIPVQGAYMLRSDFQEEARDLTLKGLKEAYPSARLSPMEDIQSWIDASQALQQRQGGALQLDQHFNN